MSRRLLVPVGVVVAVAALAWAAQAWWWSRTHVSTDDAYVEGTVTPVSAKVAGHVVELLVQDNQPVRAGDLILRIDPRDYRARRDQAQASVAVARADLAAARAEVPLARETTRAQVTEGRAALEASLVGVRSSEAAVAEAEARLEARRAAAAAVRAELDAALTAHRKAGRDLERMQALMRDDFVSRREHDDAEAALETAAANLEAARRRFVQAQREAEQVVAELRARSLAVDEAREKVAEARGALARVEGQQHQVAVKTADVSRAEARLREAEADLAVAELALAHTEVRAPLDGVVAKRSVEVGQIVQMGQPLLAIVPLHEVWVVANFKETQLTRLQPGLKAEIEIDSYPGQTFTGTVQSLSAGTGSRFSLLPPENATGNWVKVVQRVPVKILLDGTQPTNPHPLRAGMSAVVTIRVR